MDKKNRFVACAEFQNKKYPILEVTENKDKYGDDQLVIRFVHTSIHWTVHKNKDCTSASPDALLLTATDENKLRNWQDEEKVSIAEKLSYENLERHGNYIHHNCLFPMSNMQGYVLGKHRLNLSNKKGDSKYLRKCKKVYEIISKNPIVMITLATDNNKVTVNNKNIDVNFGSLLLSFE